MTATEHAALRRSVGDATCDTTTCAAWMSCVLELAEVQYVGSVPHRERMLRWFRAGEPVWMAADSLRHLVRHGAIEARADEEAAALRRMIAMGRGGQP